MKTDKQWASIGKTDHHGILVSLSSLRTQNSSGIGEFLDLMRLIDFCKKVGFDVIQLLPINDTGSDPSPYYAISSCALDPIFLSLKDLPESAFLSQEIAQLQSFLNAPSVALLDIKQRKYAILYEYFLRVFPSFEPKESYQTFLKKHAWLENYALFKSLKQLHQGSAFLVWPEEDRVPSQEKKQSLAASMQFYSFLQFLCFSQMEQVKSYAKASKVYLKGDMPILVSPDSVDVWENPSLFSSHLVAGSPPDYYNHEGQKWGFPIFNIEAMREQNFGWWKRRLTTAEHLFDLYRIDHVVGLFRIFAMGHDQTPLEGAFIPSDPSLWAHQGKELLEMMIDASSMLPIAEDLGTIPNEVRPILKELGICRTNVMRWQKRWDHDHTYIPPSEYEPLSLTTVSTADSEPLGLWWMKYPDEAKPFAEMLNVVHATPLSYETRFQILRAAHHSTSYFHINLLQEYLALFPSMISSNPEEERINIPGTILPTNWTYRFRPSIEEMIQNEPLCSAIQQILTT